eukprot:scaffold24332_cov66-Skeletonema_marinoi.AAC.1
MHNSFNQPHKALVANSNAIVMTYVDDDGLHTSFQKRSVGGKFCIGFDSPPSLSYYSDVGVPHDVVEQRSLRSLRRKPPKDDVANAGATSPRQHSRPSRKALVTSSIHYHSYIRHHG